MVTGWISASVTFMGLKLCEDGTAKVQGSLRLVEMKRTELLFYPVDSLLVCLWDES